MKRKLAASLLAGVLVAGLTVTSASAAGATGTTVTGGGEGQIYSPEDIIDVVVPTDFKVAFNPLKVTIPADESGFGLTGSNQILSGTYAIQNRSTIPVNVSASFKVTADGKTVYAASAADVAAYDAQTDLTKVTAAEFSLDLVTTAKGSAQTLSADVTDKADSSTKMRQDAAASGVKISKASTSPIALTDIDKAAGTATKDVNFMLAAGPYTPKYDSTSHKVTYQVDSKGSFDTVAFNFSGTTTTNAAKWAVATAPKVTATYTLTESSATAYASQAFDPYSKAVTMKTGMADVAVAESAAGAYTFKAAPSLTKNTEGTDYDYTKNKVSVLSLVANAKAESKTFADAGITVAHDEDSDTYKATITKNENIAEGFYLFTIGKEAFTVEVK